MHVPPLASLFTIIMASWPPLNHKIFYTRPLSCFRSAPKLFNILVDLLAYIAQNAGVSYLIHYLDYYLTMGLPASKVCQRNVNTFVSLCAELGVSPATDKLEGPSTSLSFLSIILDTNCMEIRLPSDKLARSQELLKMWLPQNHNKKKRRERGKFYH